MRQSGAMKSFAFENQFKCFNSVSKKERILVYNGFFDSDKMSYYAINAFFFFLFSLTNY